MSYVAGYGTEPGYIGYWGNGDGRFVYPPDSETLGPLGPLGPPAVEGPVNSIRWEMLREGMEDYEYLWLLRSLVANPPDGAKAEDLTEAKALLDLPQEIVADQTHFARDPRPLYEHRRRVAEVIERLTK
jgi:hypothetical protein